jgi:hypothetical protein
MGLLLTVAISKPYLSIGLFFLLKSARRREDFVVLDKTNILAGINDSLINAG